MNTTDLDQANNHAYNMRAAKGRRTWKPTHLKTDRGFPAVEFRDRYDNLARVLDSSNACEAQVWINIVDPNFGGCGQCGLLLTVAQARGLMVTLGRFVKTGTVGRARHPGKREAVVEPPTI